MCEMGQHCPPVMDGCTCQRISIFGREIDLMSVKGNVYETNFMTEIQDRCGSMILSGGQLPRPKVADVVEQSHLSKLSYLQPGSRARFWVFNAQICIPPHFSNF